MAVKRHSLGKLFYGIAFVVVLPVALVGWAVATTPAVPLPVIPYAWAGIIVGGMGLVFLVAGVLTLVAYGRGLPMNPYPPPQYVTRGIYRFTPHPIYVGFVMLCIGAATSMRSASGLWLVSPLVGFAVTALVLGYERHDLRRRFGVAVNRRALVSLPPNVPPGRSYRCGDRLSPVGTTLARTRMDRGGLRQCVCLCVGDAVSVTHPRGAATDGGDGFDRDRRRHSDLPHGACRSTAATIRAALDLRPRTHVRARYVQHSRRLPSLSRHLEPDRGRRVGNAVPDVGCDGVGVGSPDHHQLHHHGYACAGRSLRRRRRLSRAPQ